MYITWDVRRREIIGGCLFLSPKSPALKLLALAQHNNQHKTNRKQPKNPTARQCKCQSRVPGKKTHPKSETKVPDGRDLISSLPLYRLERPIDAHQGSKLCDSTLHVSARIPVCSTMGLVPSNNLRVGIHFRVLVGRERE